MTYTYTGKNFTDFAYDDAGDTYPVRLFSEADNLSFSLTFAQPLAAGSTNIFNSLFVNTDNGTPPVSWDVKAGVDASSISNFYYVLNVDASGNIYDWHVVFEKMLLTTTGLADGPSGKAAFFPGTKRALRPAGFEPSQVAWRNRHGSAGYRVWPWQRFDLSADVVAGHVNLFHRVDHAENRPGAVPLACTAPLTPAPSCCSALY
ncbi:MAG: hypothetical protein QM749_16605 [Aquabacterium sp.]